jgi:hypothetical protein
LSFALLCRPPRAIVLPHAGIIDHPSDKNRRDSRASDLARWISAARCPDHVLAKRLQYSAIRLKAGSHRGRCQPSIRHRSNSGGPDAQQVDVRKQTRYARCGIGGRHDGTGGCGRGSREMDIEHR